MSRVFARINNDRVDEIIEEFEKIEDEWHPDVLATMVDITDVDPRPEVGWVYEDGEFAPYEPELTPAEEMNMAMLTGCEVRSTAKPALDAKYIANGPVWDKMTNEVLYIVSFNKFSGGVVSLDWPTKGDPVKFIDKNDFKNVVQAIGDWLTGWNMYVSGQTSSPPPDSMTIA